MVGRLVAEAAPLVDCHVDNHRAVFHQLQVIHLDEPRRLGPRHKHRANHQVGQPQLFADHVAIAEEDVDVRRRDVVEVPQPRHIDVEQRNVGPEAGRNFRRVRSDDACPEDQHIGWRHAGDSGEQNAAAELRAFEILRPLLDAHAAGDTDLSFVIRFTTHWLRGLEVDRLLLSTL